MSHECLYFDERCTLFTPADQNMMRMLFTSCKKKQTKELHSIATMFTVFCQWFLFRHIIIVINIFILRIVRHSTFTRLIKISSQVGTDGHVQC